VITLKQIIRGCKKFDQQHQKTFYEKYYGYAIKIVFRYIYHYERAVDITNDGFVKVFKNIEAFECSNDEEVQKVLMGWMRRIMINTAIDDLRRNHLMPEIGALPECIWEEPDKNTEADQIVLYKELINEIKKLPPSYRIVFNMYVIDGFSHREIAEKLGISTGTSKSSLFKARMYLQKFIKTEFHSGQIYASYKT
jgi:RNA polymerase sigma-70 factor (ECF subfamily)